ncbi:hypothetical protein BDY21DRAFT_335705 [Lineolata rhizophorae]|uniref:Uncharacterized protein n=1 Tax=Lineolata rhizophorae TaxID=578093 RepID=A0A6A6P9H8_9PEZI|nr:hypothetical protein BDY21DRAFT_335705 [Lineolata rhizophorae]
MQGLAASSRLGVYVLSLSFSIGTRMNMNEFRTSLIDATPEPQCLDCKLLLLHGRAFQTTARGEWDGRVKKAMPSQAGQTHCAMCTCRVHGG